MKYWLLLVTVVVVVAIEIRNAARVQRLFNLTPHLIFQEAYLPSTGVEPTSLVKVVKIYANQPDTDPQRAKAVLKAGQAGMVCGRLAEDDAVEYAICEHEGHIVRYMSAPIAHIANF